MKDWFKLLIGGTIGGLLGGALCLFVLALAYDNSEFFGNVADWVSGIGSITAILFVYAQIIQQDKQYKTDRTLEIKIRTEPVIAEIAVTKINIIVVNDSLANCILDMVYFQFGEESSEISFKYPYTKENPDILIKAKEGKKFEVNLIELLDLFENRIKAGLMPNVEIVSLIPTVKTIGGDVFRGDEYVLSFEELKKEIEGREKYLGLVKLASQSN